MVRVTAGIKVNEKSSNVAALHGAIRLLGQRVGDAELREQRAGETTVELVREFQKRMNIPQREDVLVDEATADAINRLLAQQGLGDEENRQFTINGTIEGPDGRPAGGLMVRGFDQDLRTRQDLGTATTDGRGRYRIVYSADAFARGEAGTADLVVEVATPAGEVLHTTDVWFHAPRHAVVDVHLTKNGTEAEFDRILRQVSAVVEGQSVRLDELEEDEKHRDLTFVAAETGIAADTLKLFAAAHRLQARSKLAAPFWFAALRTQTLIPQVAPSDHPPTVGETAQDIESKIDRTPAESVGRGLRRAVELSIISRGAGEQIENWIKQYRDLVRQRVSESPGRTRELVEAATADSRKQTLLLDALLEGGQRRAVIERVRASRKFDDQEIAAVEATLLLDELTLNDTALVKNLRRDVDHPGHVRDLARLAPNQWQDVVARSGSIPDFVAGEKPEEKQRNYAQLLTKRFQREYPTAAFAGGLARALESERKPALQHAPAILEFLDANPEFELRSTAVDNFLEKKGADFLRDRRNGDRKAFTAELKAAQRVYKAAPTFEATNTLLKDRVHSAHAIYRMGKTKFVARYGSREGFDETTAAATWERAANTHAAVTTIIGDVRSTETANSVQAMTVAFDDFPNIANLFGAADVCECEDCRSIFSPAAYFADVLMFLDARDSVTPSVTVKDVLFERRPDLAYIDLTCENSHTPLPYVDLANEVLEDHVAPWKVFDLAITPALTTALNTQDANAVRTAFAAATPAVALSANAKVSEKDDLDSWVVRDGETSYRVASMAPNDRVSLIRQTRGTAEELAANPEYVNQDAYTVLRNATYPKALPFDLATEEVRAYLDQAGIKRADLMEVFRGPNAPNNPALADIDAEALGIGSYETNLIFSANTANQFTFWGETSNANAIAALAHVDVFLSRTGLEYADLQRLLTTQFVNPTPPGAITIQHLDSSCDTAQKRLQTLDAPALDRIHRFLRLWRKLGWKMWEVDLVIMHSAIGGGSIGPALGSNLRPFLKLLKRFPNLTVEQLAAMFGDINTHAKYTAAFKKPELSLYEKLFLNKRITNPVDSAFALSSVTNAGTTEMINNHLAPVFAATRVNQTDLGSLMALTQPGGTTSWIDGKLTLANLSFLYRHATLAKLLRIKIADWATLLFLLQRDVFQSPAKTLELVDIVDRIAASGLTIDQLNSILAGDRTAKSADSERNAKTLLVTLRKALQTIASDNDPSKLPAGADDLSATIVSKLQTLGWPADDAQLVVDALTDRIQLRAVVPTMPAAFSFPAAIANAMAISYDGTATAITFSGFMTDAQRTTLLTHASLAAVTGNPDYQLAIDRLHSTPRLLIKFYDPAFRAPLMTLPQSISFSTQLSPPLAAKVGYENDHDQLTFAGVMTADERTALDALSPDVPYRNAVLSLFNQPRTGVFPADELWLTTAALQFPLADETDPTLDNRPVNLRESAQRLLHYVEITLARQEVVQQFAKALRISPVLTEKLMNTFQLFGRPLLEEYTDPAYVQSSSALTYATNQQPYDGYYWMHRVALLLRTSKVALDDLDWMIRTHAQTDVLDLDDLPILFNNAPPDVAPLEDALHLAELMKFHHDHTDDNVSMLAVIDRLISDGTYTAALFAADVELLTEWPAADVETLVTSLDTAYPAGYAKIDAWQRLGKAFLMLRRLNASATGFLPLAGTSVTAAEAEAVKQMLRSKYDDAQWLDLSKTIQDRLRERKRDSLVAYLLTRPMPADAPTHKWENANDLFAYYLIDVEMCACMISSRIVQASAAAQLFVQRAMMGLEPKVLVSVEDDSDWLQWQWMKYYRVWEANRRVFAYPENYALPELRRDKSEIFKTLEDELLQNDVNKDTVETAFIHYIERLDDVAQLEIAGTYYQESTHTLHVFGRTPGSEPRTYYYRKFVDHRRWTPWAKVEADIKSDYLVPLIANERLHLVWPEFREMPQSPASTTVPQANETVNLDKPQKQINVYLAVTEFRSGKWTPKKVSQAPIAAGLTTDDAFDKSHYAIFPLDLTWLGGEAPFLLLVTDVDKGGSKLFELAGCRGYPEPYRPENPEMAVTFLPVLTRFDRDDLRFMKNAEVSSGNALVPRNNGWMLQKILDKTPGFFNITYPGYMSVLDRLQFMYALLQLFFNPRSEISIRRFPITLGTFYDWFYADKLRTFFVRQQLVSATSGKVMLYPEVGDFFTELVQLVVQQKWAEFVAKLQQFIMGSYEFRLLFSTFYHPLTCLFAKQLYSRGLEGLMARKTQFADRHLQFETSSRYAPTAVVDSKYPREVVDFDPDGAYSSYNWELFFHAPLMIAMRLTSEQRFDEAMRWFHFIFDPTGANDKDPITNTAAGAPQKYWITKPFYNRQSADYQNQRIENLMNLMAGDPHATTALGQELANQVMDWRRNPFDPHLVAQFRTVAYQKLTVMKYVDNLIAWGDERFRMDTLESVNEATQLYVLAAEILGPRPRVVPPAAKPLPQNFSELQKKLDAFSNALIDFENLVPEMPSGSAGTMPASSLPSLLYFCIPPNDQMLRYWDTVADRLYKIRHCLNIEGVARQLSLFAPPIDPLALVKAAAAGVDIGAALADLDAPLPHYRFNTMLQKANDLVGDLKSLGASLLAALEKKDAEALARLRQGQEIAVLQAVRAIRQQQIDDAQLVIDGLQKNKDLITLRRDYYAGREFMNAGEITAAALAAGSLISHTAGTVADILAGVMFLIPDFKIGASGFGGSPHFAAEPPIGTKLGQSSTRGGNGLYNVATILEKSASVASTLAGYQRRYEDWQNNVTMANKELEQIEKQIASAEVKKAVAEKELENQDLQIASSKAVDTFMRDKYTNQELYQWMVTQISQTYFQTYKLAYDTAKRAERCYRYEIGIEDSSFVQYGYWDSLKSGLQAGERLQLDLRRLESAYLDQNRRELECTKNVSLAMLNPKALLSLKQNGVCVLDVPEELFDFDYPGHYFRRLKTVSISIPCVAGPNTTVTCTLRLLKNRVRINSSLVPQYEHNNDDGVLTDDTRFRENHVRAKAIATSSGQNDSGLFELNFRDERYLPFEGAGAVSTWQIELMQDAELRQFSYDAISDVILHLRYTAREDAGQFKAAAIAYMKTVIADAAGRMPLRRLFDLKREFPTEWYAFLHPQGGADKTLQLNIRKRHFPYFAQDGDIEIDSIALYVRSDSGDAMVATIDPPVPQVGAPPAADPIALLATTDTDDFHSGSKSSLGVTLDETETWRLRLRKDAGTFDGITDVELEEAFMMVEYTT